jgi:hypothetical protein
MRQDGVRACDSIIWALSSYYGCINTHVLHGQYVNIDERRRRQKGEAPSTSDVSWRRLSHQSNLLEEQEGFS